MPPLLEHLESLLSGTGDALDLQTFKLVDQLTGRMLGLRADSTPQVARIDAHLLNRQGVSRLCYCGPVLHTRADRRRRDARAVAVRRRDLRPRRTRSRPRDPRPGARLPARRRRSRTSSSISPMRASFAPCSPACRSTPTGSTRSTPRWQPRTRASSRTLSAGFPAPARQGLAALVGLYGDDAVLDEAERALPGRAGDRRGARRPAPARRAARAAAIRAPTSASTWPTRAATPTTAARASPSTRRRQRRDRARRPLRRGRRGLRPQPAGRRLQPRRQGPGDAVAAAGAARADPRPGRRRRRAARRGARSARGRRNRGLRAAGPRPRRRRIAATAGSSRRAAAGPSRSAEAPAARSLTPFQSSGPA